MSSEFEQGEREPIASYDAVRRGPRRRTRWLMAVVAVAALAGFAGVVWHAYEMGVRAGSETVPPLIKAEKGPVKVRPESPGGMEVPHQDKLVYNRIGPESAETPVERLLPPPETPLPKPEPAAGPEPSAETETAKAAEGGTGAGAEAADRVAAPTAVGRTPPPAPAGAAKEEAPPAAPAPESETASEAATETTVAARPEPGAREGRYRVQLASMKSAEAARTAWARLKDRHEDLLGGLGLEVERADLGAKGVFHRVQAGPLPDEAAARKLCAALAEREVGCLVVRR